MKNIIIRVLAQVEGVKDKKRCLANLTILKTYIEYTKQRSKFINSFQLKTLNC